MEAPEKTKVVLERIMELEPENATKIIDYILLQDHGKQDMIRLAFVSDDMIKSIIDKAKRALKLSPITITSNPNLSPKDKKLVISKPPTKFTPFVPPSSSFPTWPQVDNSQIENYTPTHQPITNNTENVPFSYFDSSINEFIFHKQPHNSPLESQIDHGSHSQNVPELERDSKSNNSHVLREMKFCQWFNVGVCKFGDECKFLHCMRLTDDFIMIVNHPIASDVIKEYHVLSHGSVKKLEMELFEILKSKGLDPVPVSTLPDLYRERYGRKLEVTGYYTENYMQGKVVCDLNQLLIHLTNNIRMIQRNGEICVILAENIQMYLKSNDEQNQDLARSPACQIYVTFRPENTFTKKDLYDYFNKYGPVKSVRFPDQLQRMYGFVTFVYPVTVTVVLSKGNPHFIRGRRLLVKPYQVNNRKSNGNLQQSVRSLTDDESKNLSITAPRPGDNTNFPKKQLIIEEHDQSVDDKKNSIWEIEVACSSSHNSSNKTVAGPSAPRGVRIGCAWKGKSVLIHDYKEKDLKR